MAFTVEDGSGVAGANAYITVAFYRSYHLDRGNDQSASSEADIQVWIIKATDYVEKRFGRLFRGHRQSKAQGLEWPRLSAFDDDDFLLSDVDELPRQLQKAIAEYADIVRQISDLTPRPANRFATVDSNGNVTGGTGGQVLRTKDKVGPIEEERTYSDSSANPDYDVRAKSGLVSGLHIPEYPVADMWIEELLRPGGTTMLGRGD